MTVLEPGVDYVLEYADNTAQGTATVVARGVGDCTGTTKPHAFTVELRAEDDTEQPTDGQTGANQTGKDEDEGVEPVVHEGEGKGSKPAVKPADPGKKRPRILPRTGDAPMLLVAAGVAALATAAVAAGVIRQRTRG